MDMWGLRADEVKGRNLFSLDIGLSMDKIRPGVKACQTSEKPPDPIRVDAVNRRGRPIVCKITCMPLKASHGEHRGTILLMEEVGTEKET